MLTSDKFRDECGVVAIYAHPEAEKLAYLGLHALQHRGQESAGIVTSDGMALHMHKAMGLVADIFQEAVLAKLPGTLAHRAHALFDCGRFGVAECAAHHGAIEQGHDGAGAQRQPGQRAGYSSSAGEPGLDFSDQQRYRSHRAPDRALERADSARSHRRCAAPSRRRVLAGHDQSGPDLCGARPARLSAARHGKNSGARWRKAGHHRVRLRNLCLRSDRRHLRARCEARGIGHRRSGGNYFAAVYAGAGAIELHLRARVFLAA